MPCSDIPKSIGLRLTDYLTWRKSTKVGKLTKP